MSNMLKAVAAAIVLAGSAVASSPTLAAIQSTAGSCTPLGFSSGLNGNIVCDKFDTSLFPSALVSMQLKITGEISGTITLTNGPSAATGVTGSSNNQFFLTSALNGFSFSTPLFTTSGGTGLPINLAANTNSAPIPVSASNNTGTQTNNTLLGDYEAAGGGTFDIGILTASGVSILAIDGNDAGGFQNMTQRATATVTYFYDDGTTQTPEPASIALLGIGMVALGAARRRRQG